MQGAAYLLDKSAGMTSRKAASAAAHSWGYSKYGHAGTLDPDATGLLIVLMGSATRLSRFLSPYRKTYSFGIELGIGTDTDDTSGTVLERMPVPELREEEVLRTLRKFTGSFEQRVPDYSAVRVNGRRAYAIARSGGTPVTPRRTAEADGWVLNGMGDSILRLCVRVSSGTYVRALARDISVELGTRGAAFDIRRRTVGPFSVDEASGDYGDPRSFISMASLMRGYPAAVLGRKERDAVLHGNPVEGPERGMVALLGEEGELLAMAEGNGSVMRPRCVVAGSF